MYTIMNTIEITEPYCIKKARELYETGLLKDHLDCKNYLNQYFFSACDGTVFMKMLEPYKFHQKIVMHHEWSILRKEDLKDKLGKIIILKYFFLVRLFLVKYFLLIKNK